jgi:biopolymer transport protein ExbD
MAFGSFNESGGTQPMAEINMIPLIDVMLVLLVIFIITAPLFQQAVAVDLPRVDSARIDEEPKTIQFAIDATGAFFWNGEPVAADALEARFAAARGGDPELHLRADRDTRYETVAEVMAAAQRQGIVKIAFVTEGRAPER